MELCVPYDSFPMFIAAAYLKSWNLHICMFAIMSTGEEGLLMKAAYTCHGFIGPLMPCELSLQQKQTIRQTIKKVQKFISSNSSPSAATYIKLE